MLRFGNLDKKDIFAFLCGLFIVVRIRIVGTFLLPEFMLILYGIWGHFSSFKSNRFAKKVYFFAILWLLGTIVSNYLNQIPLEDFLKGVFFLVIFLLLIPAIFDLMRDKPERLLMFYLGSGISNIFMPYFAVSEGQANMWNADVFKFYAYSSLISGICYLLYFKGKQKFAIIVLEIVSIVGLFHASRNLFLTTTIAAIILFYSNRIKGNVASFGRRIPMLLVALLIGMMVVDNVYENLASNGTLGEDARQKYIMQSASGNILSEGRAEFFMGVQLIAMKPVFGWGSYAKDTWGYRAKYSMEHNRDYYERLDGYELLPSHSYVVGAWMQNGILGGVFWIYILILLWKIFKSGCLFYEPRLLGLLMFQFTSLLWSWAFSPFGDRVSFLFLMLTLIIIYDNYNRGIYQNSNNQIKKLKI